MRGERDPMGAEEDFTSGQRGRLESGLSEIQAF